MQSGVFIVGAPRCGTTSMSLYLSEHPEVCFSVPKENHHFALAPAGGAVGLSERAEYLDRFYPHLSTRHRLFGEGSSSYLYSSGAIDRILAFFPDARFVAMLRNPLELVPSLHGRLHYILDEDVADLAEAWSLQEARARGECLPSTCREPRMLQYTRVGMLGEHLEQLFGQVGREACFVSVFDDFAADPGKVYRRLLEFLELADDERLDFPRKWPSKRYRSRTIQRLVKRPGLRASRFVPRTVRVKSSARFGRLRRRLRRANTRQVECNALTPQLRERLRDAFAADVERLSDLLHRDLGHWLQG